MGRGATLDVVPRRPIDGEIEDPIRYMLDTGMIFEVNRIICHPLGHTIVIRRKPDGSLELGMRRSLTNPIETFDPTTFTRGRGKWRSFLQSVGTQVSTLRQRRLGITVQTHPNYKEQPGR